MPKNATNFPSIDRMEIQKNSGNSLLTPVHEADLTSPSTPSPHRINRWTSNHALNRRRRDILFYDDEIRELEENNIRISCRTFVRLQGVMAGA